jgi:hypothetical protein
VSSLAFILLIKSTPRNCRVSTCVDLLTALRVSG